MARGSEPFWPHRDPASPFAIPIAHYKWLVFAMPEWDGKTFDFRDPEDFAAYRGDTNDEANFTYRAPTRAPDLRTFPK